MKRSRTHFSEKLRPEMKHSIVVDPKGRGRLLLPTPLLVAEEISKVPAGSLTTMSELRTRLARRFRADLVCPLMTGIFYNLLAGAAEEQLTSGQKPIAPYWRVVLDDGALSPKTPDGPEKQAGRLRDEGHKIEPRRAKLVVRDFREHLAS
jgi:hypothetical protein